MLQEDGSCEDGYTGINTQPGVHECLKVIEGMEKWASRFEYRRCVCCVFASCSAAGFS